MALDREQIRQIAHRMKQGREARKRLEAAPGPAVEREHQKIAQGLLARRRAKQQGYL
jgi:hypothetical protein